jgi:4-hydroxy-tetrahydrodipicolinate synthase
MLLGGDHRGALQAWRALVDVARLLFAEPSPAPIKHWLAHAGLIDSAEVRAPIMPVSAALAARIDHEIDARRRIAA